MWQDATPYEDASNYALSSRVSTGIRLAGPDPEGTRRNPTSVPATPRTNSASIENFGRRCQNKSVKGHARGSVFAAVTTGTELASAMEAETPGHVILLTKTRRYVRWAPPATPIRRTRISAQLRMCATIAH
jgi:hypothetical protein